MDWKPASKLIVAACSFALIGGTAAQQQGQQPQQGQQKQDQPQQGQQKQDQQSQRGGAQGGGGATSDKPAPVVGRTKIGITVTEAELVAKGYRASKLLRSEVYNDAGERVGRIDELVIAPDGKLSVAVVNVSSFLGVKRHRVAVPIEQFTSLAPKPVLPGATKEELRAMPDFEYSRA
jgi:sporulation protein YlmC with PRC-barrel domain